LLTKTLHSRRIAHVTGVDFKLCRTATLRGNLFQFIGIARH
jgi:hypothetical protein